jgi:alpha-D-xyloside xylohydrolase
VQPHADVRTVYLPEGIWYDFWTGARIVGGRSLQPGRTSTPFPCTSGREQFFRWAPITYMDQRSVEPLELRIYPGRNGNFELYDDAGDGYDCESGARSVPESE